MLMLVVRKSGFGRQISAEKSENSACITPGFSPGKKQIPEPTGFSRKAGRGQTGGASGLTGTYSSRGNKPALSLSLCGEAPV